MYSRNLVRATLFAVLVCLSAVPARADLINVGNGMIYDTEQNLTWLQDVDYARTSGFDSDGFMEYDEAVEWSSNLVFGGFDDWRLSRRYGPGLWQNSNSEISRLMSQLGWYHPDPNLYDYFPGSVGPFLNFGPHPVWVSGQYIWGPIYDIDLPDAGPHRVWVVRDGSPLARVPEPSTLLLFGLAGLVGLRARLRKSL